MKQTCGLKPSQRTIWNELQDMGFDQIESYFYLRKFNWDQMKAIAFMLDKQEYTI